MQACVRSAKDACVRMREAGRPRIAQRKQKREDRNDKIGEERERHRAGQENESETQRGTREHGEERVPGGKRGTRTSACDA